MIGRAGFHARLSKTDPDRGGRQIAFSIHAENKDSVARSQLLRTFQKAPDGIGRGSGLRALTEISRVIVLQSAVGWSSVRVACHVPAAGAATSANQEYGALPRRSDDLAATLPSGATSEIIPWSGFSVTIMTRSGVPFQGANGEGKIENPVACSHGPGAASAGGSVVAKMNAAAAAAANRVARRILPTF